jgi:putative acetyltransferase
VEVGGKAIRALALAPLGIAPAYQRRGIGQLLARAGLAEARAQGWEAVIVLGQPEYYGKFGFRAALTTGFKAPFRGPAFMGLELRSGALSGEKGRIIYPVSFGVDEAKAVSAGI